MIYRFVKWHIISSQDIAFDYTAQSESVQQKPPTINPRRNRCNIPKQDASSKEDTNIKMVWQTRQSEEQMSKKHGNNTFTRRLA